MPQVDVGFDLLSLRKHRGTNIIGLEDKHPLVSAPTFDQLALFFNEAAMVIKSDLHALIENQYDRYQVLRNYWDMQHVPHQAFLSNMAK